MTKKLLMRLERCEQRLRYFSFNFILLKAQHFSSLGMYRDWNVSFFYFSTETTGSAKRKSSQNCRANAFLQDKTSARFLRLVAHLLLRFYEEPSYRRDLRALRKPTSHTNLADVLPCRKLFVLQPWNFDNILLHHTSWMHPSVKNTKIRENLGTCLNPPPK